MGQPSPAEDEAASSINESRLVEKTAAPRSLKIRTGEPDQDGAGSQSVEGKPSPHYRNLRISDTDTTGQFTPFSHFHRTGASGRSPQAHRRFARSPNFGQRTPAPSNAFEWSKESIFTPLNRSKNRHFGRSVDHPDSIPRTPQGQYSSTPNGGRSGAIYQNVTQLGFLGAPQDFHSSTDQASLGGVLPASQLQMLYGQHNISTHPQSQAAAYLPGYGAPAWENGASFTGSIMETSPYYTAPQSNWPGSNLMLPNLMSMMSIQNQMIQQQIRDTERGLFLQPGETSSHFQMRDHVHPARLDQRIRLENGNAAYEDEQRLEASAGLDGDFKRTPHVPEEDILKYADEHKQGNPDGTFSDFSGRKLKPGGNGKSHWKLTARQRRTHKRHMLAEWSRLHAEVPENMKQAFRQGHILEEIAQMKMIADANLPLNTPEETALRSSTDVKKALKILERLRGSEAQIEGHGVSEEAKAQDLPADESGQPSLFVTTSNQQTAERLQTVEEETNPTGDPIPADLDDSVSSTPSTPPISESKLSPDLDGSDKGF